MTDDELAAIEARAKAATAGPWEAEDDADSWDLYGATPCLGEVDGHKYWGHPLKILKAPKHDTPYAEYWPNETDADFIVHARQDVPALLAEVKRLRDELEVAEEQLEYYERNVGDMTF